MGKDEQFDVVVVGAGLAGLAAAASAAGEGCSVALLDGGELGGRAATDQVGRFKFNRGGHALYRHGAARGVLKRLGVRVSGALPPLKGGRAQLGDQIGRVPTGVPSLVKSPLLDRRSQLRLVRVFAGMATWRPGRLGHRTAAEWLGGLAGDDADVLAMLELLARTTTFAADFERVSADLVASQMRSGVLGVDYLHDGWGSLARGLEEAVRRNGVHSSLGARVQRVVPDGNCVRVEQGDRTIVARQAVLAVGTPGASGALLPDFPAAWSALGPPARVACLGLGLASVPEASLLLSMDRPLYLIRHSPPAKGLAPPGAAMVEVMRYLRPDEDPPAEQARGELLEHCRRAGIEPDDAEEARYLHRMVACCALPVAGNGGMRGRPAVTDTGYDQVLVAGDWVGPTGHLADAALASGERAGRLAAERVVSPDRQVTTAGRQRPGVPA